MFLSRRIDTCYLWAGHNENRHRQNRWFFYWVWDIINCVIPSGALAKSRNLTRSMDLWDFSTRLPRSKWQKNRKTMDEKQHDINQNRLYAALSYLWILCFVPVIWRHNSHFAIHHARQGIMLLLVEFFGLLIKWFIPFFGYFLSMLIGFLVAILVLFGIINALDGKYWQMPILGHYAKKIKI